jgi:uncharacterized protein
MHPMLGSGFPQFPSPAWASVHPIERQSFDREHFSMSDTVFSLLERHQRLDERLRLAQGRRWADPFEIARLRKLKLAIKDPLAPALDNDPAGAGPALAPACV